MLHIPPGHGEHLHLQHPDQHAAGRLLVSQPSARADLGARLLRAGRAAVDRPHRRQPAACHARRTSRSATCCCSTTLCFDRAGGLAQLNNPYWPQFVSSIVPPKGDELAKGTYRPSLAPVNFSQNKPGRNSRPSGMRVRYRSPTCAAAAVHPEQSAALHRSGDRRDLDMPPDPSLPDDKRDVQFTINGQFQPVIKSKAGQTEIWVLANVSDIAYINVQLTETATGRHPKIAIVGQDGNPYPAVHYPPFENGTRAVIPPASRFAIAVTIPAEGELVLEMPPRGWRRADHECAGRALHQQRDGQPAGRAGNAERPAPASATRRLLRVPDAGPGESRARGAGA